MSFLLSPSFSPSPSLLTSFLVLSLAIPLCDFLVPFLPFRSQFLSAEATDSRCLSAFSALSACPCKPAVFALSSFPRSSAAPSIPLLVPFPDRP